MLFHKYFYFFVVGIALASGRHVGNGTHENVESPVEEPSEQLPFASIDGAGERATFQDVLLQQAQQFLPLVFQALGQGNGNISPLLNAAGSLSRPQFGQINGAAPNSPNSNRPIYNTLPFDSFNNNPLPSLFEGLSNPNSQSPNRPIYNTLPFDNFNINQSPSFFEGLGNLLRPPASPEISPETRVFGNGSQTILADLNFMTLPQLFNAVGRR